MVKKPPDPTPKKEEELDVDPPGKPEGAVRRELLSVLRQAKGAQASEAYNPCPVCGTHLDADVCVVDGHRPGAARADKDEEPRL